VKLTVAWCRRPACSDRTPGQQVIYFTIREFGALTYSTIMTIRQFLSLLLSSLLFLNPLTAGQWLGSVLVFGSLYAKGAPTRP